MAIQYTADGLPYDDGLGDTPAASDTSGIQMAQAKDPGILNTIAADTIGVLWRAASGTVDPWTKKEIVFDSGAGALGTATTPDLVSQIDQQSNTEISKQLTAAGADPSQFAQGLRSSFNKLAGLSGTTVLLIGGVALLLIVVTRE